MSLTKTDSNRINAKKSTGPNTEAGKAAVKFNALKHGIYTKDAVLPTEDASQYRELLAGFRREYQPETPTEAYLIENTVTSIWRRRRVQAAEVGLQDLVRCEQAKRMEENFDRITNNAEMANAMRSDFNNARMLSELWRHDARLERSISRSLKELQRLKSLRPNEPDQPDQPGATGPQPEQQNSQEQSQTPATETESTTSDDQPVPASVLRATSTAAGHNADDQIRKTPDRVHRGTVMICPSPQ